MTDAATPTEGLAARIAADAIGRAPTQVRRFTTGARHHVYDVDFAGRPSVVVRIGDRSAHQEMAGALHLSALLRPRGVPLPALLAANVAAEFPWLILERLPGTDLGAVIAGLPDAALDRIAARVAEAQAIAAATGSAGRFGYAVHAEQAPHVAWSDVLFAGGRAVAAAHRGGRTVRREVRRYRANRCHDDPRSTRSNRANAVSA